MYIAHGGFIHSGIQIAPKNEYFFLGGGDMFFTHDIYGLHSCYIPNFKLICCLEVVMVGGGGWWLLVGGGGF